MESLAHSVLLTISQTKEIFNNNFAYFTTLGCLETKDSHKAKKNENLDNSKELLYTTDQS